MHRLEHAQRLADGPGLHRFYGGRLHRVEERTHPLAFQRGQQDAPLPRVGFVVQNEHRVLAHRGTEELVALPGMQRVRIAPEHVLHRVGRSQHHEFAVARQPDRERVAVAAGTRFEERQRRVGIVEELPNGRSLRTGWQRCKSLGHRPSRCTKPANNPR